MYSFTLSEKFLSADESVVFDQYLDESGLDGSIWKVFETLFKSATGKTKPFMLRVHRDGELVGAVILIRCSKYGRALFGNRLLAGFTDSSRLPIYLWIRFGCCMDMMSNPGFVRYPDEEEKVIQAVLAYLKKRNLVTVITDYTANNHLYADASVLPALPHALIEVSGMSSVDDYMASYKNLKRKVRTFRNKKGEYIRVERNLDKNQLKALTKCFLATADKSVFYLPYQDLYLSAAQETGRTELDRVHYFVAMLDGEFIGYQAALQTGRFLNALNGAFDRTLRSTFHAYDILFLKMTEFAIDNGLETIDFGAVINNTKQKMVNTKKEMSYYILSRNRFLQSLLNRFLRMTRIQGTEQMKFLDS